MRNACSYARNQFFTPALKLTLENLDFIKITNNKTGSLEYVLTKRCDVTHTTEWIIHGYSDGDLKRSQHRTFYIRVSQKINCNQSYQK